MTGPGPAPSAVLDRFGIGPKDRIGAGGEATVYALGTDRILRVAHADTGIDDFRARYDLLAELGRDPLPFALPDLLDTGETAGRHWAVERRYPGRPLAAALPDARGVSRRRLIEAALDATAALGDLTLAPRPWFGDLIGAEPVRSDTFAGWLLARAASGLARSTPECRAVDPEPIAAAVVAALGPAPPPPAFLHLDVAPSNILTEFGRITAVLDIQQAKLLKAQNRFDTLFATGGEQRLIQEQDQWIAPNRLRVVWKQSGPAKDAPFPTVERP